MLAIILTVYTVRRQTILFVSFVNESCPNAADRSDVNLPHRLRHSQSDITEEELAVQEERVRNKEVMRQHMLSPAMVKVSGEQLYDII